jgi:predicted ATPase
MMFPRNKGGTVMNSVINSVIKFDLHIHSSKSAYKESPGIVDNSTKENLNILLSKLNENKVALFSITDHNRFDPELYLETIKILRENPNAYPNVKNILAGVEFDIKFEDEKDKCHVIAIFDTHNNGEKLNKIKEGLDTNLLKNSEDKYSKKDFETILKEIGLNTILIASQKKGLNNPNGSTSLSDSVTNVEEIIRVGYINALEFQKPRVQGMLLDNLKDLDLPIALVSGSDCHDWNCYPYHDPSNKNFDFKHSKAKILPTFKGLLMAITSPKTRFNCSVGEENAPIKEILLKDKKIPLVNGINAIIGENGSGKTTLLELINNQKLKPYIKKIITSNGISFNKGTSTDNKKYVSQGQIVKDFVEGKLFANENENNFQEVNNAEFKRLYTDYSNNLRECIRLSINKNTSLKKLKDISIEYKEDIKGKSYYVEIIDNSTDKEYANIHKDPYSIIEGTRKSVAALLEQNYFQKYKEKITVALESLTDIHTEIKKNYLLEDTRISIKNIIKSCVSDYDKKTSEYSTSEAREATDYYKRKTNFVNSICVAIETFIKPINWPITPEVVPGINQNRKQGFNFNSEANYNNKQMLPEFLSRIFIAEYRNIDKIKSINSNEAFKDAIMSCTNTEYIETKWLDNFNKFIEVATKCNKYILDAAGGQKIGNTLGEMSLSYYKYYTDDVSSWDLFMIDQPEDNISNNNICQKLITYFNAIRKDKQLIFATHNPLLVVNLDVDNVVFVKNNDDLLSAQNGCLEYEDETTNILDIVAENMDGGKETIERRLKVYGKSY